MPGSETERMAEFIGRRYGAGGVRLHLLADSGKSVFRVSHAGGLDWVLRVYRSDTTGADAARSLASTLLFLENAQYPAERTVRDFTGSLVAVTDSGQHCLITTFLGPPFSDGNPAALISLGSVLGRLHSLIPGSDILPAGMLPRPELLWAVERLASVAGQVPPALQAEWESLWAAVQNLNKCEDLPLCFIHNDCNLGNIALTPTGEAALVDWEGAGLGPAVLDLGFLLSCCFSLPGGYARAASAILRGYRQHRQLSPAEAQRLPDAIAFRPLVLLASCFPQRVEATLTPNEMLYGATYTEWAARYEASAALAATCMA